MLKDILCETCGVTTTIDTKVDPKPDVKVRKFTNGAVDQRTVICDVCKSVLYRDVCVDGETESVAVETVNMYGETVMVKPRKYRELKGGKVEDLPDGSVVIDTDRRTGRPTARKVTVAPTTP